ncbi:eukaryotic translation initiation factor 2 alpha [Dunaliella salina]|uniref:Eukaryotic translation initiation factor 2 alpha n=1 Tax=Dunaliella salina TaxID=3046 RepID=A0ABQ7G0M9_DUNSA|nr:eukaryotic translation initiation factor 2 alpha [Dunaliella salina]|eukprot:KAF5828154.1 eukaryotic translation initiation factor 2 alpha [Dunaliella salina]
MASAVEGRPTKECRMYEQRFPEVDDVVVVEVTKIAEMGAYVSLLEYNGIEGMILLSELSRRRIRSINKLIKVGRQEPVMVLRVDKEKGYIDLSKRRVNQEDAEKCEERFTRSKMVHSIMRHVAEITDSDLEELYKAFAWPLYRIYGHAFEAFKTMVVDDGAAVISRLENEHGGPIPALTPEVKEALLKNIKRRMTPQPLKIRADVELTCFQYDGIEHIRSAMRAAEAAGKDDCVVKMKLVAPPLYVLATHTLDKQKGIDVLTHACENCQKSIEASKGKLVVKEAARAVSERDDRLLAERLEALENANKEVDGDADSDEEEEVGMGNIDVESGPQHIEV